MSLWSRPTFVNSVWSDVNGAESNQSDFSVTIQATVDARSTRRELGPESAAGSVATCRADRGPVHNGVAARTSEVERLLAVTRALAVTPTEVRDR